MDNRPIGICDSGIGGIVVLSEIIKLLPNENFIYLGDTARFPYGNKSKDNIIKYTKESIEFLIDNGVKAVVVACGTASSILSEINKKYEVPVIGIIESVTINNHQKIGVIATPRTIASQVWNKYLEKKYPKIEIIGVPCPILAPLAEAGWINNEIARLTIKEYLKPFQNQNISELILGCTHYPLFIDLIKEELKDVRLIDLGKELAKYLVNYLNENNLLNQDNLEGKCMINLTDSDDSYLETINNLLKHKIKINQGDIKKIDL